MSTSTPFTSVVMAGGGNRCFWQAGFWASAAPAIGLAPKVIAACSAGATFACTILADRVQVTLDHMKKAMAANPKNFYPRRLWTKEGAFPHLAIYRRAILEIMDRPAMDRLSQGPDIRVLVTRPPWMLGPYLGVVLGFAAYTLERYLLNPLHPTYPTRLGFVPEVISVRECRTPEELADLLLQSSCSPPLIPVMFRDGQAALDGGLIDNVPVVALGPEPGPTLVLLTRRYPLDRLGGVPGRIYVQPSEPIPVVKWDYTDPGGIQAAYDLGRRDGERFATIYAATWGEQP